jgi:hypothetical protein
MKKQTQRVTKCHTSTPTAFTAAELADHWGVHRSTVCRMLRGVGAPPAIDGRYNLAEADEYRAEFKAGGAPDAGNWRAELDRLKCALAELELAKAEGRLVSGDEVARIAQEDAAAIKTAMLGMPNALAPQLVGVVDTERVRAILDDWARTTLQAWHDSLSGGQKEGLTGG